MSDEQLDPNSVIGPDHLQSVLRVALSRRARLPRGHTVEDHIRYETAKNGVFYYAGCGTDWSPLIRFAGRCDTFIYCDTHDRSILGGIPTRDDVVRNLSDLAAQNPHCLVVNHVVDVAPDFLAAMAQPSLVPEGAIGMPRVREPWGVLVSLTCTATRRPKRLHLLYLGVDALTLYSNMFIRRGHPSLHRAWAPEYLCVHGETGGFGGGWTYLNHWGEPFSQLVWAAA